MARQRGRLEGLAQTYSLLDRLEPAAREEAGEMLEVVGRDVLAAQFRDAPKKTGRLAAGLKLQAVVEQLRLRIGLLGVRRGRASLFYGRIVEFGRRAQTVMVTRRLKRTVTGNGRTSRRKVTYQGRPYKMRVKAMAARPFVQKDRPEVAAEQRLANYWSRVFAKAGANG